MASCLNNNPKDQVLLELGVPGTKEENGHAPPAAARKNSMLSVPIIAWMVLTSALGIAGFIMAAWSTWKLHQTQATILQTVNNYQLQTTALTSAVLVSSPSQVIDGYNLVVNMFRGTGYWADQAPMVYPRSDHGAVSNGTSVWVFGGLSNDDITNGDVVLDTLVRYDVAYNLSTELARMPGPRTRFGWALLGTRIYVFGGFIDPAATVLDMRTFVYDITQDKWSITPNMTTQRSDICAGSINGKVYAAGGYDASGNNVAAIEVLSPATNTWSLLPQTMSTPRGDCVTVVESNKLYIMGGTEQISPPGVDCSVTWWLCYTYSKRVDVFDPAAQAVTRVADMLYGRGDFGAVVSSPGHILVAGGEHNDPADGVSRLLAMPWTEDYSIADDYWTPKAPLPVSRFRYAMVSAAGYLYAYGGAPTCTNQDQSNDTLCVANGLSRVTAFSDVVYPGAYLLVRNSTA